MVGQSKLSMSSVVLGFNTALSDSLKHSWKELRSLFYSMACEKDVAILFSWAIKKK